MKKNKYLYVPLILSILTFIFSAFYMGKIFYDYNKADITYNQIQNEHIQYNKPVVQAQEKTKEEEETEIFKIPFEVDFESLLVRNEDIVGWIYCPDTVINYPVVKGCNNEEYLHKDIDDNYIISGTLFADYRNNSLAKDSKSIIYGHNMKNGTMFAALTKYKNQKYYDNHPMMYYMTSQGNYKIELFSGQIVKPNDKIYSPTFNEPTKEEFLDKYKKNSSFESNVKIEDNDNIIVLSTCSYEFDNARYILIGKITAI